MHELALTQGIIDIVSSEAEKQHFGKVLEIRLKLGEYSGILEECLRDFFPVVSAGTCAEGARLVCETLPGVFHCLDCGYEGAADRKEHCCPRCKSVAIRMIAGREFFVEELKVE